MTNKRSVAIIGLGMASTPHAKSLQALSDRVSVKSVYSPSAERRQQFAQMHGFTPAESLREILDDEQISAVLLLTPPNARETLVEQLLAHGKHILMEKPLERTVAAATDIATACARSGLYTGVVFQNRFQDGALRLAQCMAQGALGALYSVQVTVPWWREQSYYDEPMRGTYERDGGGVLISQAIHTLDLMQLLAGPVAEVAAIAGTTAAHTMESEDFVGAGLRFANGAMGSLHATTAEFPGGLESIRLCCSEGGAVLTGGQLQIDYRDGRRETVGDAASGGGSADPMAFSPIRHQRLIEDFLSALDEQRAPLATVPQALQSHHLIEALLRSASESRHITLSQPSDTVWDVS